MTTAPFTGRKMLICVLSFFGVVTAANLVMMGFALKTHTGVVAPNSYAASQDFNKLVQVDAAQKRLGWRVAATTANGDITVQFKLANGAPAPVQSVVGDIGRTVTDADDKRLAFVELSPGRFVARAGLPPGVWRLKAEAKAIDGAPYRLVRTLAVRAAGK